MRDTSSLARPPVLHGMAVPMLIGLLAVATVILLASTPPHTAHALHRRDTVIVLGTAAVVLVMYLTLHRGLVAGGTCAMLALLAGMGLHFTDLPGRMTGPDLAAIAGGLLVATLGLTLRNDLRARNLVRRTLARAKPQATPAPATLDGALAQLDCAMHDLRAEHRRLQLILDHQPGCTLILDAHGRISIAGGQVLRLLGRFPPSGRTLAEGLAETGLHLEQSVDAMLDDGIEVEHRGHHLWIRRADVRCGDIGAIVSVLDVSALRRALDARGAALRFISHDIRSPQCSIIALADLHAADPGAFMQCGGMPQIARLAHHTLALSESHLRGGLDAGAMERRSTPFDLRRAAVGVVESAKPRALVRGIRLNASGCRGTPVEMNGMPDLVARVLQNLLDNAMRASRPGSTVWVAVERQRDLVRLRVRDEGSGLPGISGRRFITDLANLPARGCREGFGMGLKITAQVVAMHCGSIVFDSEPGRGTEVTVSFPSHRPAVGCGGAR